MRRWLVPACALFVVASCGGSAKPPTAPDMSAAILPAQLNPTGQMTFSACTDSGCPFEGEAANGGAGCAVNVRGVSRLLNQAGAETGRAEWSLPPTRRIAPGERFLYSGCCFTLAAASAPGTYHTTITWDNARCS